MLAVATCGELAEPITRESKDKNAKLMARVRHAEKSLMKMLWLLMMPLLNTKMMLSIMMITGFDKAENCCGSASQKSRAPRLVASVACIPDESLRPLSGAAPCRIGHVYPAEDFRHYRVSSH